MKEETRLILQNKLNNINTDLQQSRKMANDLKIAYDNIKTRYDNATVKVDVLVKQKLDIAFDVNQAIEKAR